MEKTTVLPIDFAKTIADPSGVEISVRSAESVSLTQ